jgi:hypothetical protein
MTPMPKTKTWKSKKYREYVAKQPCIICSYPSECHHVRIDGNAGIGMKPSDVYGLPLCRLHHVECHSLGVETFLGTARVECLQTII